jgi:hypothetical protein
MGETVNLEMLQKLMLDIRADIQDVRDELGRTNDNIAAIARTQVSMQRDIRTIQRDLADLKDRVNRSHGRR